MAEAQFVKVFIPTLEDSGISPAQKLVLIAIRSFAWVGNECNPSHEAIAKRCAIPLRTVERTVRELEKLGYIKAIPQYRHGKRRDSNTYRINTAKMAGLDEVNTAKLGISIPPNPSINTAKMAGELDNIRLREIDADFTGKTSELMELDWSTILRNGVGR